MKGNGGMSFSRDFLTALGAWQRGWREKKDAREMITQTLLEAIDAEGLPDAARKVDGECWRKRFLVANNPQNGGDMVPLIVQGQIQEGIASWTLERDMAYNFKGLLQLDSQRRIVEGSTAAVFRRAPAPDEIVLNIDALWKHSGFPEAVQEFADYVDQTGESEQKRAAEALTYFGPGPNWQAEVILNAPLCCNEVEAMVGRSSSFEVLSKLAGHSTDDEQEWFSKQLVAADINPEEARWLTGDRIQAALLRTANRFAKRLESLREGDPDSP